MNKTVTGKSTQTPIDLSLQLLGSADDVFNLIDNNSQIENLDDAVASKEITFDVNNTFVQSYYINSAVNIGTKPIYKNKLVKGLKTLSGKSIVQLNTYRILVK